MLFELNDRDRANGEAVLAIFLRLVSAKTPARNPEIAHAISDLLDRRTLEDQARRIAWLLHISSGVAAMHVADVAEEHDVDRHEVILEPSCLAKQTTTRNEPSGASIRLPRRTCRAVRRHARRRADTDRHPLPRLRRRRLRPPALRS
jgi:hypothetical protein